MNLISFGEILWDIHGRDKRSLGGAPQNLAAHASVQGNRVWLASSVGDDELGELAIQCVKSLGIETDHVYTMKDMVTGQCIVTLDEHAIPTYRILEDSAYDRIPLPTALPHDVDVIAFGTLALRRTYNRERLTDVLAANRFKEIYADLNIRAPYYSTESIDFCLSHSTIVKISDEELPVVTRMIFGEPLDREAAVPVLTARYPQIRLLLITCGGDGAYVFDAINHVTHHCPAVSVPVVSTVGAGDSFGATFLTQYVSHGDIPAALCMAAKVSAYVVSCEEAVPPHLRDFLRSLSDES